jgi:hypothetical protein
MNIAKAPDEILDTLKEHELALAELYGVYAEKFPEYKDFWTKFSSEEIQHADCINSLQTIVEESNDDFVVERFKIGAIENSTKYVKNLTDTARQSDIPLINALSTAVYLEQALIEKNYFEVFEGDSAQTKHILSLLAKSTRKHYEKLHAVWQEHKGQ